MFLPIPLSFMHRFAKFENFWVREGISTLIWHKNFGKWNLITNGVSFHLSRMGGVAFSLNFHFCIQYDLLTYLIMKLLLGTQCKLLQGQWKFCGKVIFCFPPNDRSRLLTALPPPHRTFPSFPIAVETFSKAMVVFISLLYSFSRDMHTAIYGPT